MSTSTIKLTHARYGKDKVRLFRVVRSANEKKHEVVEYVICALLEGEIEESYTKSDNSNIVATDSIKNTCYAFAKTSPYVLSPTIFGLHLALHFLTKYAHISKAVITIDQLKWSRIKVDGTESGWSFVRDGDEKASAGVDCWKGEGGNFEAEVKAGLRDLLVLKSTGSAFEGFIRDEYTTLKEVTDRIFSTSIELSYTLTLPSIPLTIESLPTIAEHLNPESLSSSVRSTTLEIFATDDSASVQATLYKAATKVLELDTNKVVKEISYKLPNKHYLPVDLGWKGEENLHPPEKVEVFCPVDAPSGLILATVGRV